MKKTLLVLFSIFIPAAAFCIAAPENCPSVAAINKNIEWFDIELSLDGTAGVISRPSAFATPETWMIIFWLDNVADKKSALNRTKKSLNSMSLIDGPTQIRPKSWSCSYKSDDTYIIRAVYSEGAWLKKEKINIQK